MLLLKTNTPVEKKQTIWCSQETPKREDMRLQVRGKMFCEKRAGEGGHTCTCAFVHVCVYVCLCACEIRQVYLKAGDVARNRKVFIIIKEEIQQETQQF